MLSYSFPQCLGDPSGSGGPTAIPSPWDCTSGSCAAGTGPFPFPFLLSLPVLSAARAGCQSVPLPEACPGNSCPILHAQLQTSSLGCAGTLCRGQNDKGTPAFHASPTLLYVAFPASRGNPAVCSSCCDPWVVLAFPPVPGATAGPCPSCHPTLWCSLSAALALLVGIVLRSRSFSLPCMESGQPSFPPWKVSHGHI